MNINKFVKKVTKEHPEFNNFELRNQAKKDIMNIAIEDMDDDMLNFWIEAITEDSREMFTEIHKKFANEKWASLLEGASEEQLERIYFYGNYQGLETLDEESKQKLCETTQKIKSLLIIT